MGRGDKKTAKGKRFMGSFGRIRPHKIVIVKKKEEKAS
jgi:ribosomal small subunit protein bTHX